MLEAMAKKLNIEVKHLLRDPSGGRIRKNYRVRITISALKGEIHFLNLFMKMPYFPILKAHRGGMEVMTNGFEIYQR